ncbi:MAG: DUF2812 domain-containing protein [Erysipelotrichaceae bacterium]|nr:DUF2812 domain-containing protein [Erysipelotrichaceae bacterium]
MNKTVTKFFTIADYEEEEKWLRDQHRNGWKVIKMTAPCFYTFESCEPEDMIYRLDFRDIEKMDEYENMLKDFGWEYIGQCVGWQYFRKPACETETQEEGELFSDNASKAELVSNVITTRMAPICLIFLCCVIPNFMRFMKGDFVGPLGMILGLFFAVMFVVYVYLIIYCGTKLKKIKKRYED